MSDINVKLQWHAAEQCHVAVLIRDGEPWFLDGALVGMGSTPGAAVDGLIYEAIHLVTEGENFLTRRPIALAHRIWLFKLLDGTIDFTRNEEMYTAIRAANGGEDPYATG